LQQQLQRKTAPRGAGGVAVPDDEPTALAAKGKIALLAARNPRLEVLEQARSPRGRAFGLLVRRKPLATVECSNPAERYGMPKTDSFSARNKFSRRLQPRSWRDPPSSPRRSGGACFQCSITAAARWLGPPARRGLGLATTHPAPS